MTRCNPGGPSAHRTRRRAARLAAAMAVAAGAGAQAGSATAQAEAFDHTAFVTLASDPGTPGPLGTSASVAHTGGPLASSLGSALARDDGFIAAAAQVSAPEGGHRVEWSASSQFREAHTNLTDQPQPYVFDFDIFAMSLRIVDHEGVTQEAWFRASVWLITAAGPQPALFVIDEALSGGAFGHTLTESAAGLTPVHSVTCLQSSFSRCTDFRYDFDPVHQTIALGTLQPGESFELVYRLQARAKATPFGVNGAAAFIGDPFHVGGGGNGAGGSVHVATPVPEPAAWLLLLAGGGLLARCRARAGMWRRSKG